MNKYKNIKSKNVKKRVFFSFCRNSNFNFDKRRLSILIVSKLFLDFLI